MKTRVAFPLASTLLVSLFAFPSVRGQNVKEVQIPSGSETAHALLYQPPSRPGKTGSKRPGLIVIHEWWGLNDWIKQQAQNYSDQGYVVVAIDLYRGKVATDADMAHELMRGLPQDRGVRDLSAAASWLAAQPNVDAARIGAIGWCMGGGFAAQLAVADPTLKAVVINYGSLPTDPAAVGKIHAAVLGNFGGLDRGITPDDVHAFATALQGLGKPVDVKIYPDVGHAFENPNNAQGFKQADAEDAQGRSSRFLAGQLLP
jgi:carboxymethylenebutenolidase